jgi:hypothetical protein
MVYQPIPVGAVPITFTLAQMAELKREVLPDAPYASRTSFALVLRLVAHSNDLTAVRRELDALEGLAPVTAAKRKEGDQFKDPPLFPFSHKHYFTSRHTLRSVGERWNIARGQGNRDLDATLSELAKQYGRDPDIWPGAVAH